MAARVGIATGLVGVGGLIGEGEARERAVIGETSEPEPPGLQGLAEPGSVVIAESTRRLLGEASVYRDLGAVHLKGFPEPVRAWHVVGEGTAESRFEAQHGASATALVGRDQDFALLLDRWQQAKEGEGLWSARRRTRIGKSRLVRALRDQLPDAPHTSLSHFCSPFHTNSALYPVVRLLERASREFGGRILLQSSSTSSKLCSLWFDDVQGRRAAYRGTCWRSQRASDKGRLELSPHEKKERTFQALVEQFEGLAARQPVLAIYEDVHWADPTTFGPARPSCRRGTGTPGAHDCHLPAGVHSPLDGARARDSALSEPAGTQARHCLVDRITGGKPLPQEVLEQILAKTDGVPLFVEELAEAVLESGLLKDRGSHYELTGPLPPLAIRRRSGLAHGPPRPVGPGHGSRPDRGLHRARVRTRPPESGHGLDEDALQRDLNELLEAEIVFRRGVPPEVNYSFKHALVQDIAHESLLRSKRQEIHARIVAALEEHYPAVAEVEPETIRAALRRPGWRAGRLANGCGPAGMPPGVPRTSRRSVISQGGWRH